MNGQFLELFDRPLVRVRKSKLMSPRSAIQQIEKESTLHLATTHSIPFGLVYELTRCFWQTRPRFEIVALGASVNVQVMLRDPGFLRRVITSYAGNVYPAPSPATVFQHNYESGDVPIENWSLLALVQRLMAGALNLQFMPTNSLAGSGMEKENDGSSLARVHSPFDETEQVVVRPLVPDYTLVHGWAADASGNVLARPPRTESNFGALSARKGVIASVDRIVDYEYVLSHSEDLLVPSSRTLAIVHMPYGAHPSPCRGYPPEWGYAEDEQFLLNFRNASKQLSNLDAWAKEWVLDIDHEEYLKRLGQPRLDMLRARASPDAWKSETEKRMQDIAFDAPPSPIEQMVVAMSQICVERVRERGYKTILAGQGTSNLAAWLAYYQLADEGIEVDLMAEIGFYGYSPRPPQPLIFNFANIVTCKGVWSALDVLGAQVTGARKSECIGMLGAAIVDRFGNVDSTCIPEMKTWLLGSGGANEVLSGAAEVILCCPHDIRRLWPQVPYITGPGDRVTTLVTTLGIFRKVSSDAVLTVEAIFVPPESPDRSTESLVSDISENTGWPVECLGEVRRLPPAGAGPIKLLRIFDPNRYYLR